MVIGKEVIQMAKKDCEFIVVDFADCSYDAYQTKEAAEAQVAEIINNGGDEYEILVVEGKVHDFYTEETDVTVTLR